MNRMANLDNQSLQQFGKNGRLKMEREFGEDLVIDKYLETLIALQKAS